MRWAFLVWGLGAGVLAGARDWPWLPALGLLVAPLLVGAAVEWLRERRAARTDDGEEVPVEARWVFALRMTGLFVVIGVVEDAWKPLGIVVSAVVGLVVVRTLERVGVRSTRHPG